MTRRTVDLEDWQAEARQLFGDDHGSWRFKCPNCGNVAQARDFPDPSRAGQECIGRQSSAYGGCNWAAYGLLPGPVAVIMPNGATISCFDFDRSEAAS